MEGLCNMDVGWSYSSVVLTVAVEPTHGIGEAVRPIDERVATMRLGKIRERFWCVGEEGLEVPLWARKR